MREIRRTVHSPAKLGPSRTGTQQRMENAVATSYSGKAERPVKGHRSFNWVQSRGNWTHAYNDEFLIWRSIATELMQGIYRLGATTFAKKRVVDFCGGEGLVSDVVAKQLREGPGVRSETFNWDLSSKNLGMHRERVRDGKSQSIPLRGDSIKSPFPNESLDGASIRFGLHYFPKDAQPQLMKEIFRVLKPGATLVVYHPDHRATLVPHVKAMAAASDMGYAERRRENYFPTRSEFKKMAEGAGFNIVKSAEVAEHWYSPESYAERWGGNDKAKKARIRAEVRGIFSEAARQKKYSGLFREEKGRLLKPGHHVLWVLRKPWQ